MDLQQIPPHRTVVLDPPWTPSLKAGSKPWWPNKNDPKAVYPTLGLGEIISLRPPLDARAHVYIWGLSQHMDWPYALAKAWGLDPVIMLTWCKPGLGTGRFQCNTEHVLLARKGGKAGNGFGRDLPHKFSAATNGTYFNWPRGRHSEKPDEFYDLVESLSPGPYLEMYARKPREGWTVWGNEAS